MDSPLPQSWWGWCDEDPDAASCAVFLADVAAGCMFGAHRRSCTAIAKLEAKVRTDTRYADIKKAFAAFWEEAMNGLEIKEVPGCGQGLFVADATTFRNNASVPLGLALQMRGPVVHCCTFSCIEIEGDDAYLAGPMRLCNAKISVNEPKIVQQPGPLRCLPTLELFWPARGQPAGRELRWSYGQPSSAALKILLSCLQLKECCTVHPLETQEAVHGASADAGSADATATVAPADVAAATDDPSDAPNEVWLEYSKAEAVASCLARGKELVVVLQSADTAEPLFRDCIEMGARRAGLTTFRMENTRQLRDRTGRDKKTKKKRSRVVVYFDAGALHLRSLKAVLKARQAGMVAFLPHESGNAAYLKEQAALVLDGEPTRYPLAEGAVVAVLAAIQPARPDDVIRLTQEALIVGVDPQRRGQSQLELKAAAKDALGALVKSKIVWKRPQRKRSLSLYAAPAALQEIDRELVLKDQILGSLRLLTRSEDQDKLRCGPIPWVPEVMPLRIALAPGVSRCIRSVCHYPPLLAICPNKVVREAARRRLARSSTFHEKERRQHLKGIGGGPRLQGGPEYLVVQDRFAEEESYQGPGTTTLSPYRGYEGSYEAGPSARSTFLTSIRVGPWWTIPAYFHADIRRTRDNDIHEFYIHPSVVCPPSTPRHIIIPRAHLAVLDYIDRLECANGNGGAPLLPPEDVADLFPSDFKELPSAPRKKPNCSKPAVEGECSNVEDGLSQPNSSPQPGCSKDAYSPQPECSKDSSPPGCTENTPAPADRPHCSQPVIKGTPEPDAEVHERKQKACRRLCPPILLDIGLHWLI